MNNKRRGLFLEYLCESLLDYIESFDEVTRVYLEEEDDDDFDFLVSFKNNKYALKNIITLENNLLNNFMQIKIHLLYEQIADQLCEDTDEIVIDFYITYLP